VLADTAASRRDKTQEVIDKDWDYCRYIYHKIKAIAEGDEKEDMLLDIQQVISRTRKQCGQSGPAELCDPYPLPIVPMSLSDVMHPNL